MANDYEIIELYQMLLKDDSWEPNQQKREMVANQLYGRYVGRYPSIPQE